MTFFEHGEFDVSHDGSILSFRAAGTFNVEGSEACIKRIAAEIELMGRGPFALLVDQLDWEGVTEDGLAVWVSAANHWERHGHRAMARVCDPNNLTYQAFLAEFDRQYLGYAQIALFNTRRDALSWLWRLGYGGYEILP